MSLLFETVRIENGIPLHLSWHERRMQASRKEIWDLEENTDLSTIIRVPGEFRSGIVRCRIEYGKEIGSVKFSAYRKKPIRTLKPVISGNIDYHLKFTDRNTINHLFSRRGDCDDIIIIRNGFVTDASYANLIFYDGHKWFTPAQPLLKGTCRERLLEEKKIFRKEIRYEDLGNYRGCKLINAMRYPEEVEMANW